MQFPLTLSFKKIAIAPQITVTDANGKVIMYVRQKVFKLREAVTVFADTSQSKPLFTMNADRVIDFSARYNFATMDGRPLGAVKRRGRRSLWKAHYDIFDGNNVVASIQEESAAVRFFDAMFGEIPIIGILSGYVFNPTYLVTRPDGTIIVKVKKQPSLLESQFTIEEAVDISEASELRTILAILMMTLLERVRS